MTTGKLTHQEAKDLDNFCLNCGFISFDKNPKIFICKSCKNECWDCCIEKSERCIYCDDSYYWKRIRKTKQEFINWLDTDQPWERTFDGLSGRDLVEISIFTFMDKLQEKLTNLNGCSDCNCICINCSDCGKDN